MNRRWTYGSALVLLVLAWFTSPSRMADTEAAALPKPQGMPSSEPRSPADESRPMRVRLEAASTDPFATEASATTAPTAIAPPAAPPAPSVVVEPPTPTAPPLNLRYVGRMSGPEGSVVVFAQLDAQALLLRPGMELANGYRIERITEQAVELLYPPLNATARMDLPPLPAFEVR